MRVAIDERGLRVGESHHNAKLTDLDVELIRQLHEEGMTYYEIAEKFEANHCHIGKICRLQRRASIAVKYKEVPIKGKVIRNNTLWDQLNLF